MLGVARGLEEGLVDLQIARVLRVALVVLLLHDERPPPVGVDLDRDDLHLLGAPPRESVESHVVVLVPILTSTGEVDEIRAQSPHAVACELARVVL